MVQTPFERKIIHLDMDAFYASVEQCDNPQLRGKPVAVGGGEKRGVLTTASYEARQFGVKSAMPGYKALKLCPELIFVKPRFDRYKEISQIIRQIFHRYTDLVEPLSLDEAYLDVTYNKINNRIATEVARMIQNDIFQATQLTCSAGVSYCKFLAKVASDLQKPNGITIIKPRQASKFLEQLPIEKFHGIGKVTAKKMHELNIYNGSDLKKWSKVDLANTFGKAGIFYFDIVRGIDERPVKSERKRKSLAVERTLESDIADITEMKHVIENITQKLWQRMNKSHYYGRTLTLKIKTSKFQNMSRSTTHIENIDNEPLLKKLAYKLLQDHYEAFDKVRLLGLTVSNSNNENSSQTHQITFPF